jgi:hypothetical protein
MDDPALDMECRNLRRQLEALEQRIRANEKDLAEVRSTAEKAGFNTKMTVVLIAQIFATLFILIYAL